MPWLDDELLRSLSEQLDGVAESYCEVSLQGGSSSKEAAMHEFETEAWNLQLRPFLRAMVAGEHCPVSS